VLLTWHLPNEVKTSELYHSGKQMNEKRRSIHSDLNRLDSISDKEIDYSDSPETDEKFWNDAELVLKTPKTPLTIRIDSDVLSWFKSHGKGYQTIINAVLKSYMSANR
jgi:uncharacterized protein (DUF4415 family)